MIRGYAKSVYHLVRDFLYRRTRYKLFLKTSLESVDQRARLLAGLTDYFSFHIQPILLKPPFASSILVLAPHQDDEIIGCGGTIALHHRAGTPCCVFLLQDGADEHAKCGLTREQLMLRRNDESTRAANCIGLPTPVFFNAPSLRAARSELTSELIELVTSRRIDAVFTPSLLDFHPDHQLTNIILADALDSADRKPTVFCYEVWGLVVPNVAVPIDNVIRDKERMLSCFDSANAAIDYVTSTLGLNMYRSRLVPNSGAKYVECFFQMPAEDFISVVRTTTSEEASS